jgi:REP element-mobilizing transposase RayT
MAIILVKTIDWRIFMPRKKREWYPQATYHVTARGNRKSDIFVDDKDYKMYMNCMKEALDYYENKFIIYCYCLMKNHVHLQIKTSDMPLGDFIKRLNSTYAKNFNIKYNYIGHLFQGRYGAKTIKDDSYNLEVSRYIHLNPVKANIVIKAEEYKWSSYGIYIGKRRDNIIKTEAILSYFNRNKKAQYRKFVEGSDPWAKKE